MDFNWYMFKISIGLVVVFFGIVLAVGKKSNVSYRNLGLWAVAFLGYMYAVCAGFISGNIVRILGLIGASAIFYRLYLNKKGK